MQLCLMFVKIQPGSDISRRKHRSLFGVGPIWSKLHGLMQALRKSRPGGPRRSAEVVRCQIVTLCDRKSRRGGRRKRRHPDGAALDDPS